VRLDVGPERPAGLLLFRRQDPGDRSRGDHADEEAVDLDHTGFRDVDEHHAPTAQLLGQKHPGAKAGDTFHEPTGWLHRVSKNPSKTGKTRVLAVVPHPEDVKDMVIPEKKE